MKTAKEIQEIIFSITGYRTTVSNLTGSMKAYTRFKIKGTGRINNIQAEDIIQALGSNLLSTKVYIDQWSVDVNKTLIKEKENAKKQSLFDKANEFPIEHFEL